MSEALNIIRDVSKWSNLGAQLGVSLSEISLHPPEEQKTSVIVAWFKLDPYPTYEKLYHALLQTSVDDRRAAERVVQMCKDFSFDSSISVDGMHDSKGTLYVNFVFKKTRFY